MKTTKTLILRSNPDDLFSVVRQRGRDYEEISTAPTAKAARDILAAEMAGYKRKRNLSAHDVYSGKGFEVWDDAGATILTVFITGPGFFEKPENLMRFRRIQ